MSEDPKSMGLFFIDNRGTWPNHARLVGDLVMWEDSGKYPTSYPIAAASHPAFDGRVVVQAVPRCVVISFVHEAKNAADIMASLSALPSSATEVGATAKGVCRVTQYQLGVDAIINRVVLDMVDTVATQTSELHPFALLKALAFASPADATVLSTALRVYLTSDAPKNSEVFSQADDMLSNIEASLAEVAKAQLKREQGGA